MSTTPGEPQEAASPPDPMADPTPDQVAMGLRRWMRRIVGTLLLVALLVVIVRGIYVVWDESRRAAPLVPPISAEPPAPATDVDGR